MNPNTATNEELRDWLALRLGWTRNDDGSWGFVNKHGKVSKWSWDPIPNSIDAAHDCFHDGWTECWNVDTRFAFRTLNDDGEEQQVNVARTADEATDRFRLAAKAIMAMEEARCQ